MLSLVIATLLTACSDNPYNQGTDLNRDTTESGIATDTGEDADTDADADSDTDADADADSDTDADTDPGDCSSAWDPVQKTGWVRTYNVEYMGAAGTGTQSAIGPATSSSGEAGYSYKDSMLGDMAFASEAYDTTVIVGCEGGSGEGLYAYEWNGTITHYYQSFPITSVATPPRMYLPSDTDLGNKGGWDYTYTLAVTTTSGADTLTYNGTYLEIGFEDYELPNGHTVEAYRLTNSFSLTDTAMAASFNGYIEQWWVKGIGLVKELSTDADSMSTVMSREIVDYTGLTPE